MGFRICSLKGTENDKTNFVRHKQISISECCETVNFLIWCECPLEKVNASFRTIAKYDFNKKRKIINILWENLNDYLNDNPVSFQLLIQVMLCIEDFTSSTSMLFVIIIYPQIHILCGLQKISQLVVVGG